MFLRRFRSAAIGLSMFGAALAWCGGGAPAWAQTGVASPPDVTVDLGVLDSLGSPPRHRVNLHPPQPHREAAKPAPKPRHDAAKKKSEPKKAAAKPAHPAKKAEAKPVPRRAAHAEEAAEDDRAARADAQWEADRKRAEADRKREADRKPETAERGHDAGDSKSEMARIKREEAERIRQAKAEIEEAARTASAEPKTPASPAPVKTPARMTAAAPRPDPGPATPPPPRITVEPAPKAEARTGQIAAAMPPPSSPPRAVAPSPAPARPAALEKSSGGAPHVDFAAGTADLSSGARSELDALAKTLVADEDKRVQLVAYATGAADEANQARRLSLSRALNVRAYLIDHGVRNTRMDVRALGNRAEGSKPADRVIILLSGK